MRTILQGIVILFVTGCTSIDRAPLEIEEAEKWLGYNERSHRTVLREYTGVDPVKTEWCAAFVNAVLANSDIPGSETVSDAPLMARSFLQWGEDVKTPKDGDIVIFPRGNSNWKGHVGFYVGEIIIDGELYYKILGGNQRNQVSIEYYNSKNALGIRRYVLENRISS